MPEFAINKNHQFVFSKHNVGLPGQLLHVFAVSKAQVPKGFPQD
jgi:hypothetical protein